MNKASIEERTVIAIDHGFYQMKTPNTVFTSGVTQAHVKLPSSENVLEYDGKMYQVGTKRKNHETDKTKTEDYYLLTMAAIAKENKARNLSSTFTVELSVGLPLTHYNLMHEKFTNYLKRDKQPIEFVFDGKEYCITIENVHMNVQGFGAIVYEWFYGDIDQEQDEPVLAVIDIGGWTTDIFVMVDGTPQADSVNSLEIGMIVLTNKIKRNLQTKCGVSLMDAQIEKYLIGNTKITIKDEHKAVIDDTCRELVSELLGKLAENMIDASTTPLIFLGGGTTILAPFFKEILDENRTFYIDDVRANAKGYEVLTNELT